MNKRNILIIISILTFIVIVGGVSYSYFVYNKNIGDVTLTAGDISINLSGVSSNQTLTNVMPISDYLGKSSTNYFDFTVNATVDTERIYYGVYILPDSENTLDTSYLKTYLTDQNDVMINGVNSFDNLWDSEVENGKVIYKGIIEVNQDGTTKTETKDFRLRLWIDENYNGAIGKTFDFDIYLYAKNVDNSFEIRSAFSTITEDVDTSTVINFANPSSDTNGKGLYILPGTPTGDYPIYYYRGEVDNNNVIFGEFCWQIVRTTDTGGIKMIYNGETTGNGTTCENTTHETRVLTSNSAFSSQRESVADIGYMKNVRYVYGNGATTGAIYGKDVEWNGNSYLVIENVSNTASTNETKDNYHHYSCGIAGTTSCTSVRYYYFNNYYITLSNGEKVEDALYKMTGSGSDSVKSRNASYVLNNIDSTVKEIIENWFRTNLTNEIDSTKNNYQTYLEDTIYCNDRSFKITTGNTNRPTYLESGWNPNGGDLTKYLYFGSANRAYNGWYSISNVPSTICPNETDRFSVRSSVAHLNYPVGLLTADETVMAGAGGNGSSNSSYYLYTGNYYWSLSPTVFNEGNAFMFYVISNGYLDYGHVSDSISLRPVVSLKPGTEFESGGDGTLTNPYVVKYE